MEASSQKDSAIREEIEFARAVTALFLAIRLDQSEEKAHQAYSRIVDGAPRTASNQ